MISYCIVDDNAASRRMIENIIEDCALGKVIGSTIGGREAIDIILSSKPNVILIDLLMPELDGIEMIKELKTHGYNGKFIMISQINNKEMVGEAYKVGIEFFIHKPINSIEVEAVLKKINKQLSLDQSIVAIKASLASIESMQPALNHNSSKLSVMEAVQHILKDLGVLAEKGSKDIIIAMELLIQKDYERELPPLNELYKLVAQRFVGEKNIIKEKKAIEQRVRRTIGVALKNIASIGLTDYTHPKFEQYASLFFEFQDVRNKMKAMESNQKNTTTKVNVKKFLQVLYLETLEKIK
ncbi:response regulator [Sutcliffiella rhizosphaerae]|uniref:Protein-glutamate methylesterase/protein-glutamine glutaminase n=1 Tax=Sutcliffiella rhizosphaerae TaxID=2880967 RepID=A0ABN8A7G8_9BACI|nr:response regulator [Sutcliffiella rhizosphaerae]CAG9621043.1 Protein-glutamate methylesterase/protein-glutamine glutaminase [Sutcliffiella rhizosphaerae]